MEDQRYARMLSSITYALWYKDQKRRPAFKKYLQKLDLWDDREALFMWPLDESERKRQGFASKPRRGLLSDQAVEKSLASEKNNGWGDDLTVADLMAYKRRKAGVQQPEKSEVPDTVYLLDGEKKGDDPDPTRPQPERNGRFDGRDPLA